MPIDSRRPNSLTEEALRKENEADELEGTCLWQGERARIERLRAEAAEILYLEEPAELGPGGEVIEPRVTGMPAAKVAGVERMQRRGHRIQEDASIRRTNLLLQPSFDVAAMALDAAGSVEASNSVEKMLAHQMALTHEMVFKLADRAMSYEHNSYGDQVEVCRVANTVARLMTTFQAAALTLQRLRTGGSQTVTVQHVNVAPGGQAVVGTVQTGGGGGKTIIGEENNGG